MKSAIAVTGQFRTLETTFPFILNNIVIPNNGTLFILTDDYDKLNELLSKYPKCKIGGILCKKTFIDDEYRSIFNMIKTSNRAGLTEDVFERSRKSDGINWQFSYLENSGSVLQYYQFWKIWNLVVKYEREHNIKFTHCVRTRTDIMITKPITVDNIFKTVDIKTLILDSGCYHNSPSIDYDIDDTLVTLGTDHTWIGTRNTLDKLSNLIFYYGYWDSGFPFSFNSETTLHQFCKNFNITHIGIIEKNWPLYTYSNDEAMKWLFSVVKFNMV
jgi:hypothetical protein